MNNILDEFEKCLFIDKSKNIKFDANQYFRDAGLTKKQQIIITHSNNWLRLHNKPSCPRRIRKKLRLKVGEYNRTKFFGMVEETIDEIITDSIKSGEWFNQFADIKDLGVGEPKS